ncbi:MAG: hypothetical protein HPY72_04485 [Anaerolineae bacterium]|nr:hypothetical protein [Anaerolineae bacterium]
MTDQDQDRQIWRRIRNIIAVNLSVVLTIIIWLALFVSMLVGYFSIPLLVIGIVLTYLAVRDRVVKANPDEAEKYRDTFRDRKD